MDHAKSVRISERYAKFLDLLTREEKGELLEAIVNYAFHNNEDNDEDKLETNAKYMWPFFKLMIDAEEEIVQTNVGIEREFRHS